MNRETCEQLILDKLEEIVRTYREYNPEGKNLYLTVSLSGFTMKELDGRDIYIAPYVKTSNEYFTGDYKKPLNASKKINFMEDIENE